ncbi:MAG: hypothetical protein ACJ8BW_13370 [Ktedonobacteraceae bacterium]
MPSAPSLEKKAGEGGAFPQSEWQEGALGLLLLAAAELTALLSHLQTALPPSLLTGHPSLRLAHCLSPTLRRQLLTLLFLEAVGLRRTWDLRGYTGQALALLTDRHRAYGYRHTERFLAELASVGADVPLTEALACWTASLWEREPQQRGNVVPIFYVDGHRKPVYADALLPRGLIGRTGKVLGCRALVVLHDQEGHPLLVTTHRGDQHLTIGLPAILTHYEQAAAMAHLKRVVVDREGMSAELLAALASEGRTVVTVLRTDQYTGVESFRVWACGCVIGIFRLPTLMPVGIACSLSFSCRGGSSGNEIESRWNSSHLTTVPSTAIWRRCAQRLRKSSRVYRMDAPSSFVCKGLLSFHF